jgi:hypothetical protein
MVTTTDHPWSAHPAIKDCSWHVLDWYGWLCCWEG